MRQVAYAHSRLTVSLQDRLDHVDRIVLVSLADHLRDALLHDLNETRADVSERGKQVDPEEAPEHVRAVGPEATRHVIATLSQMCIRVVLM